jgi:hypothetical protein
LTGKNHETPDGSDLSPPSHHGPDPCGELGSRQELKSFPLLFCVCSGVTVSERKGGLDVKHLFTAALTVTLSLVLCSCSSKPREDAVNQTSPPEAKDAWSLGIYTGPAPFDISQPEGLSNPVLTAADVTDFDADILAHPFMVTEDSKYYLFFTVKYGATEEGGIGLAESDNGFDWEYQQLVVDEPYVVAYPYVFKWQEDYYMIPETHTEPSIRLYKATDFPLKWTYEKDLLSGDIFISASVIHYNGMWWMFVSPEGNHTLRLFYAPDLTGTWTEHPLSPIVEKNPDIARPGGRLLVYENSLYRMGQDCAPSYGNQVHAFHITEISPTSYKEEMIERPLVKAASTGWNAKAMHHVDFHQVGPDSWIAAVDALGIID